MESQQFRDLILLLRENLQDSEIPHRTTISKRILELQAVHLADLSAHIQVCDFRYIIYTFLIFLIRNTLWGGFPSLWTAGQTITSSSTWLSLHTG